MGKKRALVIGINEYEDTGFDQLKYAESDAKAIYDILVNQDIGEFAKEDVILLTGKSKSEVEENLETTLNEAKRDDLVFIYFAGHGKLDKSANLCLAARNTKTDRLLATSIHLEHIRRIIDQSDCKRIVFIIDSCFSGAAGQSFRSGDVPAESFEQISGQGKVIISASQAFERARERDDLGHGIFTYNLVKGLEEGEADHDGDGYISVEELYKYISKNVKAETKGQQVPMKWGIDEKGEIVIAKSIKTLEKKRLEIESLSSRAKELENQGRLDEALDAWSNVLELDPKNMEAPQGVKQVEEEKKKRAELEAKIDRLFDYYKKGSIPGTIYNKAFGIMRNPHASLSDEEGIFTRLVEDLLNNNLSVENFVLSWNMIEKPEHETDIEGLKGEREAEQLEQERMEHELQEKAAREEAERKEQENTVRQESVKTQEEKKVQAERMMQEERRHPIHEGKLRVQPKQDISVLNPSRKLTRIFAGAGVIVLVIAAIMFLKKGNPPVLPPEIANFTASPTRIEKGGSSTLEWKTSNASEVQIRGIGKVSSSGTETVTPLETTSFTLIAKNEENKTVEKTATVEVNVPPTKELPESSQILFQDNFATLDPAWGPHSSNLSVQNAKLILQPELNNSFTAINQANLFEDLDVRVKVNLAKSDNPRYGGGVIFWAKDSTDYYYLLVTGEGWFSVQHWVNQRSSLPVQWRESAAIKKGIGQINQLRVVTKGNQATVYINDTEVVTFKGQPPQGGSFIGLIAFSPEKAQNKNLWEFSELKVMKP
jgi:uncharacterized caspase-like protein